MARKGNTPTCVGKTAMMAEQRRRNRKHPHMRGEDACRFGVHSVKQETPPHAWGRLQNILNDPEITGNTPTCVGKTREKHF